MKVGVIGGHSQPSFIQEAEIVKVETKYGMVNIAVTHLENHELFFINRHGVKSDIPPHKVNYRANIQAFSSSHVECIIAIGTVGSMKKNIKPGDLVIPNDFIDVTKSRQYTFFDNKRIHVDMINPYCPFLREKLFQNANNVRSIKIHNKGIYLATEGPRLESVSEIQVFSNYADIVSMTGVPEVILAREKGLCYAMLCVVCNMAAGFQNILPADEISSLYKKQEPIVSNILKNSIKSLGKTNCNCKTYISQALL